MANTRGAVYDYGYFNDAQQEVVVSLTECLAAAGNFQAVQNVDAGAMPPRAEMRHVGVVDSTGKHHQVYIADPLDTHFQNGGTLTFGDFGECTVVGKTGELWPL